MKDRANLKASEKYGANKDKEWEAVKFKCFMFALSLVTVKHRLYNSSQSQRRVLHNESLGAGFGEWLVC